MNKWIISSAIISSLTIFLHILGGGPEVHDPMLASNLSPKLKAFSSVLWHGITAILIINSILLFISAFHIKLKNALVWSVTSQYMAFAIIFIFYGIVRLETLFIMPQWIIFSVISGLALLGLIGKEKINN